MFTQFVDVILFVIAKNLFTFLISYKAISRVENITTFHWFVSIILRAFSAACNKNINWRTLFAHSILRNEKLNKWYYEVFSHRSSVTEELNVEQNIKLSNKTRETFCNYKYDSCEYKHTNHLIIYFEMLLKYISVHNIMRMEFDPFIFYLSV